VPRTAAEFLEETEFEASALSVVAPSAIARERQGTVELGSRNVVLHMSETIGLGDESRRTSLDQFRPLLFGCAWKVIDLLVELGLNLTRGTQRRSISTKAANAESGVVRPFSSENEIWRRVCALYRGFLQARHCLVHRRFAASRFGLGLRSELGR